MHKLTYAPSYCTMMQRDSRIRYSRRDRCFWVDIPEGMISCDTKADAIRFLFIYDEYGMKGVRKFLV